MEINKTIIRSIFLKTVYNKIIILMKKNVVKNILANMREAKYFLWY